jgi:hypothetical protein
MHLIESQCTFLFRSYVTGPSAMSWVYTCIHVSATACELLYTWFKKENLLISQERVGHPYSRAFSGQ